MRVSFGLGVIVPVAGGALLVACAALLGIDDVGYEHTTLDARAPSDDAGAASDAAGAASDDAGAASDAENAADRSTCVPPDAGPELVTSGQSGLGELASDGTHLFWIRQDGIAELVDGGGVLVLASTANGGGRPFHLAARGSYLVEADPSGIRDIPLAALGTDAGHLHPTVVSSGFAANDSTAFYAVGGNAVYDVLACALPCSSPANFTSGGTFYASLIAVGSSVYFAGRNPRSSSPFTLYSCPLSHCPLSDAGTFLPTSVLVSGLNAPTSLVLAGANLYYADLDQVVVAPSTPDSGAPLVIASGESSARAIAVDGASVYFATTSAIRRVPTTGGCVVDIATGQLNPTGLVVLGPYVYWGTSDGRILRAAK